MPHSNCQPKNAIANITSARTVHATLSAGQLQTTVTKRLKTIVVTATCSIYNPAESSFTQSTVAMSDYSSNAEPHVSVRSGLATEQGRAFGWTLDKAIRSKGGIDADQIDDVRKYGTSV